jgi:hypothetical protein
VERDHGQAPAHAQARGRVGEEAIELPELVVDLDAQRHEGARGGVDAPGELAALAGAHRRGHHVGQAPGGGGPGLDHGGGDARGLGLLAVLAQDPGQARHVDLGEQLGRGGAL